MTETVAALQKAGHECVEIDVSTFGMPILSYHPPDLSLVFDLGFQFLILSYYSLAYRQPMDTKSYYRIWDQTQE